MESLIAKCPLKLRGLSNSFDDVARQGQIEQSAVGLIPIHGARHGGESAMGCDQSILATVGVGAVTRPTIFCWCGHDACTNGVELDISLTREQVFVCIDERRLVSAFPQCAGACVHEIELRDILASDFLHHPGQRPRVARRYKNMNMVGHQDVSVDCDAMLRGSVTEAIEIEPVVCGAREHPRAVVSALNDVQHRAGEEKSRLARHSPYCLQPLRIPYRPKVELPPEPTKSDKRNRL